MNTKTREHEKVIRAFVLSWFRVSLSLITEKHQRRGAIVCRSGIAFGGRKA
jgi:hypothetical protein